MTVRFGKRSVIVPTADTLGAHARYVHRRRGSLAQSTHPPPPQVVGATGSTTIAFILPGLLYLKVHPEPHPKRSLAALQLAVGLLIIPLALTFIALGESPEGTR